MRRYTPANESFPVSQPLQADGFSGDLVWLARVLDGMAQRMGPVSPFFFVQGASRRPCIGHLGIRKSPDGERRGGAFWLLEPGDVDRDPLALVSQMLTALDTEAAR